MSGLGSGVNVKVGVRVRNRDILADNKCDYTSVKRPNLGNLATHMFVTYSLSDEKLYQPLQS